MRNIALPIIGQDYASAHYAHNLLNRPTTGEVRLHYVKRDGTVSSATGTIIDYPGTPDTDTWSVRLQTERGPRTINLCRITGVQ